MVMFFESVKVHHGFQLHMIPYHDEMLNRGRNNGNKLPLKNFCGFLHNHDRRLDISYKEMKRCKDYFGEVNSQVKRFQAYISSASSLLELTDQEFWVAGVGLITDGGNAFLLQKSLTKTKFPYYDIYVKKKRHRKSYFSSIRCLHEKFTQNLISHYI